MSDSRPLYSRSFVFPPVDGSVTLPDTLDFHLEHNADLPIYTFHEDKKEFETEVSYLEFARACHRAAHTLAPQLVFGEGAPVTRPVVAFMALADSLVYQAIVIGMMRIGVIPFPISPRNTSAAVAHLLQKTSCHYLVSTPTLTDLIQSIKEDLSKSDSDYGLTVIDMPHLRLVYPRLGVEKPEDDFEPYTSPLSKQGAKDLGIILHSSGSTGFPKAIPQTHGTLSNWAAFPSNTMIRDHTPRTRVAAMHLPPFHTLGIYAQVIFSLYGCSTVALYPPIVETPQSLPIMPTPENILDHVRRTRSNAIITIPTLLQIWAQDQKSVEALSKLIYVGYSGGAVSPKLGDFMVASGVALSPSYGGTEFGSPTYPFKRKGDEKDWSYVEFSDRCNIKWVPQGDGTYECHFLTSDTHPLPIENLPDVKGYATADIFEPHPTKPYLWKIVGRIDDVIIHSSGEKTVPAPMENIIMSSIHIMGTIMFGQAHDQPGLLVEPKHAYAIDVSDSAQVAQFRNLIWPVVEEANKVAPMFSQIFKEMMLVTSREKPLPRAGKGTVMRKAGLKEYEGEIEALYADVESTQATESIEPPKVWDEENVQEWILVQVTELNHGREVVPSEDLFEQGFDSLSATILRRRITGALQSTPSASRATQAIGQNTIYAYPTVDLLASYLTGIANATSSSSNSNAAEGSPPTSAADPIQSRVDAIQRIIAKYSQPTANRDSGHPAPRGKVIMLTGSTGNLGSQILEVLLKDERVGRVYAFNRPAGRGEKTMMERHMERFADKALDKGLLVSEKLVFVEGELAKNGLGLSHGVYDEIRHSVDVIIHTAWRLDFNLSLASFESSIRATRNLVDLARASPRFKQHVSSSSVDGVKFIFTSSVASALSWDQTRGPYPEEVIEDPKYALGNGYGEGKYVTERILATSGLNATSLRIGQISGGRPNGAWAVTDWIPILVKSSLVLGALPRASGFVSWIPMDAVAGAISDLTFLENSKPYPQAMNVVHPTPVEWNTAIEYIAEALAKERGLSEPLPMVPFSEWFYMLESRASSSTSKEDEVRVPAIKLRDFFKHMADYDCSLSPEKGSFSEAGGLTQFSIDKIQAMSKTMQGLAPMRYEDAERWVKYWNQAGMFDS